MTQNRPTKSATEQSALTEGTSRMSKALVRIDEDSEPRKRAASRRLAIRVECAKAKAFRAFSFEGEYSADKAPRIRRGMSTRLAVCAALALSVTAVVFVIEAHLGSESTLTSSASTYDTTPKSNTEKPKIISDSSSTETQPKTSGGSTEPVGSTGSAAQPETKDHPAVAAAVPTDAIGRAADPLVTSATGSTGHTKGLKPATGASAATGLDLSIHIDTQTEAGTNTQ